MSDVVHISPGHAPTLQLGETALIRSDECARLSVERDGDRCLALLSVLCRRIVGSDALHPIEAAAHHWASGDKALANLRLVFAGLPRIAEPADAARLQAAAYCLDQGIAPRDLMKALDLDASVLNKFNPDQPRVPVGNGEESGRWTDETRQENFIPSLKPPRIRIAADGPFKPEGIETVPSGSIDPLDQQI